MTGMPPPPPRLESLPAGAQLVAGLSVATVLPDMDFETYSEAGHVWDPATNKWRGLPGASQGKKGLGVVGAAVYAQHPSTEVLSLYYDLKDGRGRRFWRPGLPNPQDLFDHMARGGLMEAWNVAFERWIWNKVCVRKYGWPPMELRQCRDAMAKSRAFAMPGALGNAAIVMGLENQKDKEGKRLLDKFSVPRNPTIKDKRVRITPDEDPVDGLALFQYNEKDIIAEAEASSKFPDLEGEELEFWLADQAINYRGVQMDVDGIKNCIAIVNQAHTKYNAELYALTGGEVARASELAKMLTWLHARGVHLDSLDEEHLTAALETDDKNRTYADAEERGEITDCWIYHAPMRSDCRRALEIRAAIGSAAVKKVFAMWNQLTSAGRLHDLFSYHAAHTGRATGNGPQPTNLPNSGPEVMYCFSMTAKATGITADRFRAEGWTDALMIEQGYAVGCRRHFGTHHKLSCPWCQAPQIGRKPIEWHAGAVVDALEVIGSQSLELVEFMFGDAMATVSGCLRGLFIAPEGKDLICSDYSAIEAVGLAESSGEEWRREVFRTHGKIYEMSASKISGVPFEEFAAHRKATGQHHPLRKKVGKIAELAFGYQGWIGAAVAFGMDEYFNEPEIKQAILAWRAASPFIVEMWGGQYRGRPPGIYGRASHDYRRELFGVEGMFVAAVLNPGALYAFRGITFQMRGDALYLRLASGRPLTYHRPRLSASARDPDGYSISFEGWNTNPKNGPPGWIRKETWGGRLVENIVQATCRDILRHAIVNLERVGYAVVLHVYDEIVAEIPKGWGSIEEFERIMATMPPWAKCWPIKAAGGWRGLRYRKD